MPTDSFREDPPRPHKMVHYEEVKAVERAARRGLSDEDDRIKAASIRILGGIAYVKEDLSAEDDLSRYLRSPSSRVRRKAGLAFDRIERLRRRIGTEAWTTERSPLRPAWWREWQEQETGEAEAAE